MKKTGKRMENKELFCDDWCFVCKDGGKLYTCDYKDCLKAYHAGCVKKDEAFFDSGKSWSCMWHSCLNCRRRRSKFHCFCCPNAVCEGCMIHTEFACVRGDKGFCNDCLRLALLSEGNVDVYSDGEKVDLEDRETYEGLFKEYWDIIKEKEGLTLEDLRLVDAQLKSENFSSGSYAVKSVEDEDSELRSDYEDEADVEEHKKKKKNKSKAQVVMKRKFGSKKRDFIGWGSKALIDFLASIGEDTSKELSPFQVSNIITRYVNENMLFDSEKKKKIQCDESLKLVLGKKTVKRNKIDELLEPHFVDNQDSSEDEFKYCPEDMDENVLVACKKQKKLSTCGKIHEKVEVVNAPQSCFASITPQNIKLLYLRRSLVEEILKKPGNFEEKLLGSFVKIKSEFIDFTQRSSHQLLQVTGVKEVTVGETKMEILLQVSNMSIDIGVKKLSDDNFSEEECENLRKKVKDGLLRKLTVVELQLKAKSLHEDITNHWIKRELVSLANLIDHANEKGWRKELFEYMERRKLLQTPEEKSRLLETVPSVIADVAEVEPISHVAVEEYKQEDLSSPKSIRMEGSESPGDSREGSGFPASITVAGDVAEVEPISHVAIEEYKQEDLSSPKSIRMEGSESPGDSREGSGFPACITVAGGGSAVTKSNYDFGNFGSSSATYTNENAEGMQQENIGSNIKAVQLIDLSSDDDDNDSTDIPVSKEKSEELDTSLWLSLGPDGEKMRPLSLRMLKLWSEAGSPYALKFKVWKEGDTEENAISITEAVRLYSLEN